MRLGMVVRADFGRGLAQQTYTFWEYLQPDVTVVVDMSLVDVKGKWPQTLDAYPDAIRTTWKGYTAPFENPDALAALSDCDVVYSAETYYDERLPDRVAAVLHVNPEFYRGQKACQYWYPTMWLTDSLPAGPIVPTPLEAHRIRDVPSGDTKLLHVGGHRAAADRNGSMFVGSLLRKIRRPWRITSQDGMRVNPRTMGFVEPVGFIEDRWQLYEGCGILVYPRRYGGQSLVVNEAMARGLAVVMGDNDPNTQTWPIVAVPTRPGGYIKTPAGRLQMSAVLTEPLATAVTDLEDDRLFEAQQRSLDWAKANTWQVWGPQIRGLLEDAC